jgi:alanine dehydrogenase
VGLDWVEDNAGGFPFTKMMGEIVGQLLLPIATEIMSSNPKSPILLGNVTGVPQKKLVILGAGNVTQILIKHAFPLGLNIEVFDKDIYKLQRLKQELNLPLSTQVIDSENLPLAMQSADLIIGALRSESGITPCIVTEEMVSSLNPGTLIMDICIDQGGCFETSEITNLSNPTFEKYGITHYCVPNIASKVAQTASLAISNLLTSFILKTGKTGGVEEMIWQGKSFMKGIYCFGGYVTNKNVAKILGIQAKDIQLLLMRKG